jgi:cell wall-associated hydrolases (invasion-associated proteins)
MRVVRHIAVASTVVAFVAFSSVTAYAAGNIAENSTIDFNEASKYGEKATPVITDGKLVVKSSPDSNAGAVGTMAVGSAVDVMRSDDSGDGWIKISSNGIEGWVKASDVVTGYNMEAYVIDNSAVYPREATIIADGGATLTKDGGDSAIAVLKENDTVKIVRESEDYLYVKADRGLTGYIEKSKARVDEPEFKGADKIEVPKPVVPQVTNPNYSEYYTLPDDPDTCNGYTPNSETELRKEMSNYGLQWLGRPYVFGGTSFDTGIDCSAFTQNIYRQFGISLPRTAAEQATVGREIAQSELRAGDLLFYWDSGRGCIGHVTMYIGNNKVVHASNPRNGVIVSNAFYRAPTTIRRYIED